jgi:hypothetical protein
MQQTQQSDQTAEGLVVGSKHRRLRRVSPYCDYFAVKAPDFVNTRTHTAVEAHPPRRAAVLGFWGTGHAAAAEVQLTAPLEPCAASLKSSRCRPPYYLGDADDSDEAPAGGVDYCSDSEPWPSGPSTIEEWQEWLAVDAERLPIDYLYGFNSQSPDRISRRCSRYSQPVDSLTCVRGG